VFDEIDTGISGRVAGLVGAKIAALAGRHQVLCITHLPQIASLQGRHFKVSKRSAKGQTATDVAVLDAAGREAEVASLIGGGETGPSALAHARELLAHAASRPA
jgi:DNA repair protein RecN (Recombination protein N)